MAAVVAEVMVAAIVIERVVYCIVTGAGRVWAGSRFGPVVGTAKLERARAQLA